MDGALAIATAAHRAAPRAASSPTTQAAAAGGRVGRPPVLSYADRPGPAVDLTDEDDVRRFVRTYVLPAIPVAPTTHQER